MSSAEELISHLRELGIKLELINEQLCLDAPKGALTAELKQKLTKLKPDLVLLLNRRLNRSNAKELSFPLSNGQERIWTLHKLRRDSGIYNIPMVYELKGALDFGALEYSLNQIQERHSILRTRFFEQDGEPQQQISRAVPFSVQLVDFTNLNKSEQSTKVCEELEIAIQQTFDLGSPPLWRCKLIKLSHECHVLVFTMHHIIFDRFSKTVFLRELEALYTSKELPGLTSQYCDFALWQQSAAQQQLIEKQMSYWQAQLGGKVEELLLPTDHPRTSIFTNKSNSISFSLSAALTEDLDALSRTSNCSLYMTLMAAFSAFLFRYTGQTDQIVCSPFACRNNKNVESLIGYFNNILPIRIGLGGAPSFRNLLNRVRQVTIDASKNQDVPFQSLAQISNVAHTALTRGMFNFRSNDTSLLYLPNLIATPIENRRHQADFDLALYMGLENDCLAGVLDYNSQLFEASTIDTMLGDFKKIMEMVVNDPALPLCTLPHFRPTFKEIENTLIHHPKIEQAVVVSRSDSTTKQLVAYLVLNEYDIPTWKELKLFVEQQLPAERDHLTFLSVDEMPTFIDGTVDLASLPTPTLTRSNIRNTYVAPRTPLESKLVDIWSRVIWREEKIGIYDDFFDLGGHSLLSVQLIQETEKQLNKRIPTIAFAQLSNVADFAKSLENADETTISRQITALDQNLYRSLQSYTSSWAGKRTDADSLVVGVNTEGRKQPVFWCVQRYLNLSQLAKHLGSDQPLYGMRSGHNVMEYSPENLRNLASYYVAEILKIQNTGPYIIGGICQAAEIAFQMAKQLIDLGREVNLLGLQERFIPQDYTGPVAFFFGEESDRNAYFHYANPELGWRKYYTGEIKSYLMQGGHGQYFQEANIPSLAKQMELAFQSANRSSTCKSNEIGVQKPGLQRLNESSYQAEITLRKLTKLNSNQANLAIRLKNISPDKWLASQQSGVYVGARWQDSELIGTGVYCYYQHANQMRSPIPTDLMPGESLDLNLEVQIPEESKHTVLEIDMVDEGIKWFSTVGSQLLQIEIPRN